MGNKRQVVEGVQFYEADGYTGLARRVKANGAWRGEARGKGGSEWCNQGLFDDLNKN